FVRQILRAREVAYERTPPFGHLVPNRSAQNGIRVLERVEDGGNRRLSRQGGRDLAVDAREGAEMCRKLDSNHACIRLMPQLSSRVLATCECRAGPSGPAQRGLTTSAKATLVRRSFSEGGSPRSIASGPRQKELPADRARSAPSCFLRPQNRRPDRRSFRNRRHTGREGRPTSHRAAR